MRLQWSSILVLPVALVALSQNALAQGNSHGHGNDKNKGHANAQADAHAHVQVLPPQAHGNARKPDGPDHDQGRGNDNDHAQRRDDDNHLRADNGRANNGPATAKQQVVSGGDVTIVRPRVVYVRPLTITAVRPVVRRYVVSTQPREHVAGSAIAYAFARGIPENTLTLVPVGSRLVVRNRGGASLVALDDNDAMRLGAWRVVPLETNYRQDAPAFCRSGAGHPVWGRQWCLDKGFGLGTTNNVRWGRIVEPTTVMLQPTSTSSNLTTSIAAEILRSVLGASTFDRLALHALTLGYSDPLVGRFVGEPTGPRTMVVSSGVYPVAEIRTNRDNRADNMIVALRPW